MRSGAQGAWAWLNFHYEPWESDGSAYFGAAVAAIAVGTAPGNYAANPEIQDQLKLLRDYLQQGADTEHLFNAPWFYGHRRSFRAINIDPTPGNHRGRLLGSSMRTEAGVSPILEPGNGPIQPRWKHRAMAYATGLIAHALHSAGLQRF